MNRQSLFFIKSVYNIIELEVSFFYTKSRTCSFMENNLQIPESWYVIEVANIDNIIIWQEKNGRIYVSRGEKTEESFESLSEYILKI